MANSINFVAVSALLADRLQKSLAAQGVDPGTLEVSTHSLEAFATACDSASGVGLKGMGRRGQSQRQRLNLALVRVDRRVDLGLGSILANPRPVFTPADPGSQVPCLCFDLHYLLSTHARDDSHAGSLLGRGMLVLEECDVIRAGDIEKWVSGIGETPTRFEKTLLDARIERRIEAIRVSPVAMGPETRHRLGPAFGLGGDLHASYGVSVELSEGSHPTRRRRS